MRTIEWLLAATAALTILTLLVSVKRRSRWMHLLPWLTAGLLVTQLIVEGFRWQLEYLYGFTILLFLGTFANIRRMKRSALRSSARDRTLLRIGGFLLGLAALAATGNSVYHFPMFTLPIPSGTHQIGTRFLTVTDSTRPDPYTADYEDFRMVSLQIWYPASVSGDDSARPYLPVDAARFMAEGFDLPEYSFSHFALIETHTIENASVAGGGPYPVVLYSPSGLMTACVALAEEMASRGYVFVAVGHPHWNPYYFADDGTAIPGALSDGYYRTLRDELNRDTVEQVKDRIIRATSNDVRLAALIELNGLVPRNVADVRDWAADVSRVIDALAELNASDSFWRGKLDLGRIGVAGFSKGGCAAGQVCLNDPRVRCGVNLDGFMYGDIVSSRLATPFMFMHGETAVPQAFVTQPFFDSSAARAYQLKIWGAQHANFGDVSLYGQAFGREGQLGSIDGARCVEIQNIYVATFLDRYLKGSTSTLLDQQSPAFPEVEFNVHDPVEVGDTAGGN